MRELIPLIRALRSVIAGWGREDFLRVFSGVREDIPIMRICCRGVRRENVRLRGAEASDEPDEFAASLLEVAEHIVAGAGGAEQDDVAGGCDRMGHCYGVGEGLDKLDFRGS